MNDEPSPLSDNEFKDLSDALNGTGKYGPPSHVMPNDPLAQSFHMPEKVIVGSVPAQFIPIHLLKPHPLNPVPPGFPPSFVTDVNGLPPCDCVECELARGKTREQIEQDGWRELQELSQPKPRKRKRPSN